MSPGTGWARAASTRSRCSPSASRSPPRRRWSDMRILITNDDGIDAPGIRWLTRAVVRAGYDVVVAAPLTEASGSSAAMTAVEQDGRIVVQHREIVGAKNVPTYAVAA